MGDHQQLTNRHVGNEFIANRKIKAGMVDGRSQFTELREGESPTKQTNYCFCKGVTSAKTLFFFSGVTDSNPCTQMNCYEKYAHAPQPTTF